VDHQDVAHLLALGHDQVDAGEVVLDLGVFAPPGRLVEDAGGIVALGLALHGVPGEVLAADIDAEGGLPVAEGLVSGEGKVPAGAAVGLGQAPFAPELVGGGADLLGGVVDAPVLGEQVHAGGLHVFVEAQATAHLVGLAAEGVLLQEMPRVEHAVALAPFADLPAKRIDEHGGDAVVVVIPRRRDAARLPVVEQLRQARQQVVAVALRKRLRQGARPGRGKPVFPGGHAHLGVRRLVGEDPRDHPAERRADMAAVRLMGDLDERAHGLAVHGVQVGLAVVPARRRIKLHGKQQK
jgi:hypothetical protein